MRRQAELGRPEADACAPARPPPKKGEARTAGSTLRLRRLRGDVRGSGCFKTDTSHRNDFSRIAVVGERKWMASGTNLAQFFYVREMRWFEIEMQTWQPSGPARGAEVREGWISGSFPPPFVPGRIFSARGLGAEKLRNRADWVRTSELRTQAHSAPSVLSPPFFSRPLD